MIIIALASGLRYAEIIGLTQNDFNFDNNTITINKTWGYHKNMKKGFGLTKNVQSNRTIIINHVTMELFKDWMEVLLLNQKTNNHQLIFYSAESKYSN